MAKNIAVKLLLFSALLFAGNLTTLAQHHVGQQALEADAPAPHGTLSGYENVAPMAAAQPRGSEKMDRSKWTVDCDSQETPFNCSKVFDGNEFSFWRSASTGWPHMLTVNLKAPVTVSGISMLPSREHNKFEGNIATHEVYVSLDGRDWGTPVAYGTWWSDNTEKFSVFEPTQAQHVRLIARSAALGENFINIAEFNIWIIGDSPPQTPAPGKGRWGPTVDFPIVPAGAWVEPLSGRVVTFSSYGHDRFDDRADRTPRGRTLTATWNPTTKQVSQRIVNETQHDMFCPGMSFDAIGRMIVTGGRTNKQTSIYGNGSNTDSWVKFAEMQTPRGYQSSVTCDDGRIFLIGGSWESIEKNNCAPKDGEVYDPAADTWTPLPQCPVTPMWTAETTEFRGCNTFRRDNHGWLFPWKNNTVFQAGPSKAMNWYTVSGRGGVSAAGRRSDDDDAMCGVAVMYDASQGQILTAGGSKTYVHNDARKRTYIITLNDTNFNSTVTLFNAPDMGHPRIYHSAVVLPNGETMVVGGRTHGEIFKDGPEAVLEPEIYSPTANSWTRMASHSIARSYHSFALLLPDATVLAGGGGLCPSNCDFNHFDAQIFTPPYLITSSGGLATRPRIVKTSAPSVLAGGRLTLNTDSAIVNASLVRYGSATHGLNTDQRRIPLKPMSTGANQYDVIIPRNTGIVIPGYWMLFVINAQGVPSKAATVQIRLR